MIEISIITINYNGLNDTCALIETIPNNDNLEVIVVDNASKNQEAEADAISKKYPHVKVVKSEKNLGFAGGNNLGIKAAQGKYLFFIKIWALKLHKVNISSSSTTIQFSRTSMSRL